ncbi:unnamed protein product [Phyllotreta striolata]|uniref:MADF domain-containing protein n=1 Tax=Phyllotreta striolata TaxID=444603 RepID=A0A9N9THE2_PHYSR|nr:unnamed protein product [Phyllotreta striolata]
MDINVPVLLREVEKRPLLWDKWHEDFKERLKKNIAWTEVCEVLFDDYNNMEESQQKIKMVEATSKWRHVRDNFLRSEKKQLEAKKLGLKRIAPYLYSRQLQFLRKTFKIEGQEDPLTVDTLPEEDSTLNATGDEEDTLFFEELKPLRWSPVSSDSRDCQSSSKKRKRRNDADERLANYQEGDTQKFENYNDDHAFFMSLLPMVKMLNTDEKLQFRIDVLQLLKKYRNK